MNADEGLPPDDSGGSLPIIDGSEEVSGGRVKTRWTSMDRKSISAPLIIVWISHIIIVVGLVMVVGVMLIGYFYQPVSKMLTVSKASRRISKAVKSAVPAEAVTKPEKTGGVVSWLKTKSTSIFSPSKKNMEKTVKIEVPEQAKPKKELVDAAVSPGVAKVETQPMPASMSDPVLPRAKPPRQQNILDAIRKDPARSYVEKKYEVGDLSYEVRNVSELGMELYVENSPYARITYYFPAVIVDGFKAQWESTVLSPGKGTWGWVEVPNIRNKPKVSIEMSAVGGGKLKEKVKLDW